MDAPDEYAIAELASQGHPEETPLALSQLHNRLPVPLHFDGTNTDNLTLWLRSGKTPAKPTHQTQTRSPSAPANPCKQSPKTPTHKPATGHYTPSPQPSATSATTDHNSPNQHKTYSPNSPKTSPQPSPQKTKTPALAKSTGEIAYNLSESLVKILRCRLPTTIIQG